MVHNQDKNSDRKRIYYKKQSINANDQIEVRNLVSTYTQSHISRSDRCIVPLKGANRY